jgi:hypothetical protein
VPEYKVTQCITRSLGFRNFNQMINHWRVQRAKAMLGDARLEHLPVLTIALDCGFGSIGPFNRAFKAQTGMTPTQFRSEARRSCLPADPVADPSWNPDAPCSSPFLGHRLAGPPAFVAAAPARYPWAPGCRADARRHSGTGSPPPARHQRPA